MNHKLYQTLLCNRVASFHETAVARWLNEAALRESQDAATMRVRSLNGDVTTAGVAVIPVRGVLTYHPVEFFGFSFGGATSRLRRRFNEALADDGVGAIVLDFDSPGGVVDGIPELAADMRSARGKKPVIAVANTMIASGAYWLAAQADEIVVSPSADIGSVGVFVHHLSFAGMLDADGVKSTIIRSVPEKAEVNPYEDLTEGALAHLQARVDETDAMFVADIAKGRQVKAGDVRSIAGRGRLIGPKAALAAGLADRVATIEQVVAGLVAQKRRAPARRRSSLAFA